MCRTTAARPGVGHGIQYAPVLLGDPAGPDHAHPDRVHAAVQLQGNGEWLTGLQLARSVPGPNLKRGQQPLVLPEEFPGDQGPRRRSS